MIPFVQNTQWHDRRRTDGEAQSPTPSVCQLNRVRAGRLVRIKQLSAPPAVTQRLREIGLGEQQVIRLLARQSNLICLVCNARLALSSQLGQMILVEPLPA
jgi:Fe2+ transport system protein FeoA